MEGLSRVLDKMKIYLTSLNYPNIQICSEDDIVQIFAPQNRIKLLMWIFNMLSDAVAIPLEEKAQISYMADIIYQWGFCKLNEKISFVKCELEMCDQFVIFARIFRLLVTKESTTATVKEVNFQDLMKMVEYSNNLKKRVQKSIPIKAHEDHHKSIINEIDRLQSDFNALIKVDEFEIPTLKDLNVEGFEDELVTFATNSEIILSSAISSEFDNTSQFGNMESLGEAVSILNATIKHVTNMKIVSKHKEMASLNIPMNERNDKWCDINLERLERMLQKCQPGKHSKISVQDHTKHLETIND